MGTKKPLRARVDELIQERLREQAVEENRTFSNHVETVLKNHVEKKNRSPHQPKQEYGNS